MVNVGAGTGNYEPRDRDVIAIEPSEVMIAQRAESAAPAIQGVAEDIPLDDGSVDAAMAVITDHHWASPARGLEEMLRVARTRVVALTLDFDARTEFWLTRDYVREARPPHASPGLHELAVASSAAIRPIPVPHDCADGFALSFWRRPEAYLDPAVRAGISIFHLLDADYVERAMKRLSADIESGAWSERNGELLELDELDLGLRLVIWETSRTGMPSQPSRHARR